MLELGGTVMEQVVEMVGKQVGKVNGLTNCRVCQLGWLQIERGLYMAFSLVKPCLGKSAKSTSTSKVSGSYFI